LKIQKVLLSFMKDKICYSVTFEGITGSGLIELFAKGLSSTKMISKSSLLEVIVLYLYLSN
jgi:hypothetical protein